MELAPQGLPEGAILERKNQAEWHCGWKGQFPKEQQEIIHTAANNEKHLAEVKTDQSYVIEFQHLYLASKKRVVCKVFYYNMVWVDGTRLKKDYPRFLEARKNFRPVYKAGFFLAHSPEEYSPLHRSRVSRGCF